MTAQLPKRTKPIQIPINDVIIGEIEVFFWEWSVTGNSVAGVPETITNLVADNFYSQSVIFLQRPQEGKFSP